jgi:hypothetical protein
MVSIYRVEKGIKEDRYHTSPLLSSTSHPFFLHNKTHSKNPQDVLAMNTKFLALTIVALLAGFVVAAPLTQLPDSSFQQAEEKRPPLDLKKISEMLAKARKKD